MCKNLVAKATRSRLRRLYIEFLIAFRKQACKALKNPMCTYTENTDSGDDALMGHTRSHPEHDG